MFDIPPKCPALADKLTGLFGWRHTYRVHQRHKDLKHHSLHKTYSLNIPRRISVDRASYQKCNDSDSCVIVHHLHSQSGILDPDDRLSDVADDRERIVASFEDGHGPEPNVPQGGGDGASGSSVGTGSPDIFRGVPIETTNKYTSDNIPHIEVTELTEQPQSGLGLQVRRGSEPTLHQLVNEQSNFILPNQNADHTKRWSAAPVCRSNDTDQPERILLNGHNTSNNGYPWSLEESELEEANHSPNNHLDSQNNFSRSGRLSMQFLGDGAGYRWMDAADRLATTNPQSSFSQPNQYTSKSLPRELKRKEPLGQAYESIREKHEEMLLIVNEPKGPLGLTAIPDCENGGLLVQLVEPGSRAERGRLRRGDRILEINGTKLIGLSDHAVQVHLRKSLNDPELRLRVIRGDKRRGNVREMIESGEKLPASPQISNVATISPTRKIPGAPINGATSLQAANTRKLGRRIEIALKKGPQGLGFSVTTRDNPAGGDCPIYIKNILPRGAAIEDGRLRPGDRLLEVDNIPMTGKTQTEVVGILRATQSGTTVKIVVSRQQELVEIDEREIGYGMNGINGEHDSAPPKPPPPVLPQKPVKSKSTDSIINIKHANEGNNSFNEHEMTNSIHSNVSIASGSGRSLEGHKSIKSTSSSRSHDSSNAVFPWRNREVLTLHIPVHDTEKAGLGVSVKGKTGSQATSSSNGNLLNQTKLDGDLGIFIKSVINGGAASRDGRLKMNDQLLSVNGISLLGQSNAEAMETLRRAMLKTAGKFPGMITLTIARRISSRSNSSTEQIDTDNSNNSEKSGATVIYLNSEQREQNSAMNSHPNKRWSNPVLDRLTGGTGNHNANNRPTPLLIQGLRNESYYMATNETWSPGPPNVMNGNVTNNSVLIEEDPEPSSPAIPFRPSIDPMNSTNGKTNSASTPTTDATYSSQLSLDTNPPADAFSRDAVGRRSISEKHHAALDAKETGTYQRNKKLREEREREKQHQRNAAGSVESLTGIKRLNTATSSNHKINKNTELYAEALDCVGELGPSLGLKKSSSLESLQTMVQEIQMSDEPRGPSALRTPRGRGREESLRAAVENHRPPETQPRKHWLLEDGPQDETTDGGFVNRNSPFQSSLNDRKHNKMRQKKPSILKGIGHMFRFGKHRKDGIAPTETLSDFGGRNQHQHTHQHSDPIKFQTLPQPQTSNSSTVGNTNGNGNNESRKPMGPPMYQPPPPVSVATGQTPHGGLISGINKTDLFNHRYSHYVNYEELQHQISISNSAEQLSETTLDQMRRQVMHQRTKVEEESRRHQHYHSQRSSRNDNGSSHHQPGQQRPISSYYEYETIQQIKNSTNSNNNNNINSNSSSNSNHNTNNNNNINHRKISIPNSTATIAAAAVAAPPTASTTVQWNNNQSSGRNNHRGPFVTQVTIRDQHHHSQQQQPASQV